MIASPGDRPIIERYVLLASSLILRYGLVVVVAWIGALKYTDSEAVRIQQYITHSPFMSWMADALNVRALSNVLGVPLRSSRLFWSPSGHGFRISPP